MCLRDRVLRRLRGSHKNRGQPALWRGLRQRHPGSAGEPGSSGVGERVSDMGRMAHGDVGSGRVVEWGGQLK